MTRVFEQQSAIAPLITPNGLRVGGGVRQASGLWQPAMVDPATGECVWQGAGEFSAAFGIWSPRFAIRRNAVFVFNEGWLGCFDAASGAQRWKVPLGGDLSQSSRRWLRDGATDDLTIDVLTTPEGSAAIVRNGDGLSHRKARHHAVRSQRTAGLRTRLFGRLQLGAHISLKAFGPKGGLLWRRDLEDAREHFCSGADVVVELFGQIAVLDASDGSTRLAYTS